MSELCYKQTRYTKYNLSTTQKSGWGRERENWDTVGCVNSFFIGGEGKNPERVFLPPWIIDVPTPPSFSVKQQYDGESSQ